MKFLDTIHFIHHELGSLKYTCTITNRNYKLDWQYRILPNYLFGEVIVFRIDFSLWNDEIGTLEHFKVTFTNDSYKIQYDCADDGIIYIPKEILELIEHHCKLINKLILAV